MVPCAHSLNAPCLYIKNSPKDSSLEPKHVANYVLMIIYMLCLTEYVTLSYCITQPNGSYQNFGYLRLQTHTLKLYNTHCFPTATMVARTRLNVTLFVHCLSCLFLGMLRAIRGGFWSWVEFKRIRHSEKREYELSF